MFSWLDSLRYSAETSIWSISVYWAPILPFDEGEKSYRMDNSQGGGPEGSAGSSRRFMIADAS